MKKEKKTARPGHHRIFIKCFHHIYMRGMSEKIRRGRRRKKEEKKKE